MCLIIHKPKAKSRIDDFIIDNAEDINPDGFGIVYTDDNSCITTMDYDKARELLDVDRPYVAHYRYATRGAINLDNTHPFPITENMWLFSNGTVSDLGDDNTSDTQIVSKILGRTPPRYWRDLLSMTDTRFCITSPSKTTRYGQWHERDGIYYSKANCFHKYKTRTCYGYGSDYYTNKSKWATAPTEVKNDPCVDPYGFDPYEEEYLYDTAEEINDALYDWGDVNLVAVYGTLKAGRGNHSLLTNASYEGAGHTVYKYPLQIDGCPYVFDEAGTGHHVCVEVYSVWDDDTLNSLDMLEGHPTHYERKIIDIQMLDGSVKSCWLYFDASRPHNPNKPMLQTY